MMKSLKSLVSALALSTLLTSAVASTEPLTLTEAQLDAVTAGGSKPGVGVGSGGSSGGVTVFGSKPGLGVGTGGSSGGATVFGSKPGLGAGSGGIEK